MKKWKMGSRSNDWSLLLFLSVLTAAKSPYLSFYLALCKLGQENQPEAL